MSVVVTQDFDLSVQSVDKADASLGYWIRGTDDEFEARAEAAAQIPLYYDGRRRSGAEIEHKAPGTWFAKVTFSAQEWEYHFEASTTDVQTLRSLSTISRYAPSGVTAPNFRGAIGVTRDGIEGTSVPVPNYEWSETHYFDIPLIDATYKRNLRNLCGKMNNAAFREFARGEVQFRGASGGLQRGKSQWQINFRFASSENVTGLTIGSITGIDKLGWDYLWVDYIEKPDPTSFRITREPRSVHVERVIEFADFKLLRLPA